MPTRTLPLLLALLLAPLFTAAQTPTTPSSNITFSNVIGNAFRVSVTRGDGERRILVLSENPVAGSPTDGIDYNPDPFFGDGDALAPGGQEFVIFDTPSSTASTLFNGLTPAITYYLAIFEYNGEDQQTVYQTAPPATASFTTLGQPSVQVSDVTVSEITGNSADLSWTNGDGDGTIVVFRDGGPVTANPVDLESYVSNNTDWRNANEITPGNRVVFDRSNFADSFSARRLEPSKTYHYAVYEYNGSGQGKVYAVPGAIGQFMTAERPSATGGTMSQRNSTTEGDRIEVRYSEGNGEGRIWVAVEGTDVSGTMPTDGTAYTADADFGDGDVLGNGFVVRRVDFRNINPPTVQAFSVRNLEPNTTYTVAQYEFDYDEGFNGQINYQLIPPATFTFSTAAAPLALPNSPTVEDNTGPTVDLG